MMRIVLENVGIPQHLALAYDGWAPVGQGGKIPESRRVDWLSDLANISISPHYSWAFKRWESSFNRPGDRVVRVKLVSRLLVGHGNTSATDVGLSVHHTWGVPFIPGAALKGLLAHYVDAVYGPDEGDANDSERMLYRGVTWDEHRVRRGPGKIYRALFGAPDADDDSIMRDQGVEEVGAAGGNVLFQDALYVPRNAPDDDKPFATDVLTVHQKQYYDTAGKAWPNDYESPTPVQFLTVRPGAQMLLALSGPPDWTELAEKLLLDALREWGVGGKTSSGYGRFVRAGEGNVGASSIARASSTVSPARGPAHSRGQKITVVRVEVPGGKVRFRAPDGFLGHFAAETPPAVDVGEAIDVWVANSSPQGYTLTVRQPKEHKR